jgi:hypothetical protein
MIDPLLPVSGAAYGFLSVIGGGVMPAVTSARSVAKVLALSSSSQRGLEGHLVQPLQRNSLGARLTYHCNPSPPLIKGHARCSSRCQYTQLCVPDP